MIQYTTKDLVRQALSKADLENSDFIRHSDNVSILNDCWTSLYQKAINAGEKFFITTIELSGGSAVYILPDDFFQMYALTGKNGIEIPRRSAAEMENGLMGYDIRNNRLYVFNVNSPMTLEYFPKPVTLTFPFEPVKYGTSETFVAGHENKVYNAQYVMNLDTNEIEQFSNISGTSLFQVFNDYIVTFIYNDQLNPSLDNATFYIYDIQTLSLVDTVARIPIQDINGDFYTIDWSTGNVYDIWGDVQSTVDLTGYTPDALMVLLTNTTLFIVNGVYGLWDSDGVLYYTNAKNKIMTYNPSDGATADGGYEQRGVLLEDNNLSGRGIWFNNTLYSASSNILLNYPNNVFFSLLSYQLAVQYKVKQGQDPTSLMALSDEAEYNYFNSIQQDINEFVRIKNVY